MKKQRSTAAVAAAILCAATWSLSSTASQQYREHEVKAAFLFNFAKFVEWPPDAFARPSSPIIIGILGEDPFGVVIDRTVRGKEVNGRPLAVKRLQSDEAAAHCHILFVSSSESARIGQILVRLRSAPVLTVGEVPGFAERGGIVNFLIEQKKVRFEINPSAAKRAGISVSSKLLSLAKIIEGT